VISGGSVLNFLYLLSNSWRRSKGVEKRRAGKGFSTFLLDATGHLYNMGCPNNSTRFNFVIQRTIYSKSADIFISV
jgi:hypothetical protein